MKKVINCIVVLLISCVAACGQQDSTNERAVAVSGKQEVWLFTHSQCGQPCEKATLLLDATALGYRTVNVADGPDQRALFTKYGGKSAVPLLVVGDKKLDRYRKYDWYSLLAEEFGVEVLPEGFASMFAHHYDDDGDPRFVMYATSWCPYCEKVRKYLHKRDVPYAEYDVEKSAEAELFYKSLEGQGFPLIYVGPRRISGANMPAIEKAVNELMLL